MIGRCGEVLPAESYFATALVVHVLGAHALPPRARTVFQGITLGYQTNAILTNWRAGYSVNF